MQLAEWIDKSGMKYLERNGDVGESQADAQELMDAFLEFKKESRVRSFALEKFLFRTLDESLLFS